MARTRQSSRVAAEQQPPRIPRHQAASAGRSRSCKPTVRATGLQTAQATFVGQLAGLRQVLTEDELAVYIDFAGRVLDREQKRIAPATDVRIAA
ncbi:MAG TPA: hypothetical protein VF094_08835 [Gaiellaceae bacterium]